MEHTFLFRGSPRGRADSIDHWLVMLAGDALLLSETAGGRSFAHLSERLASLAADRSRKGRGKYHGAVREAVETLLAREQALLSSRTYLPLYPMLAMHLQRKARYALRRVCSGEEIPSVSGAPAMKEGAFCLSLVRDTAELCMRYLDPTERTAYMQAGAICHSLADLCARAEVYGASCGAEHGCSAFAAEADEAVGAYREFLAELDSRVKEGRLLAVFPPTFLVWADGTCALAHRCLKRLARGKSVIGVADELDDDIATERVCTEEDEAEFERLTAGSAEQDTRAESAEPLVILADSAEETAACEEEQGDAQDVSPQREADSENVEAVAERIYAKASDYKNVVEKAVQRKREHSITKPRPLGRR